MEKAKKSLSQYRDLLMYAQFRGKMMLNAHARWLMKSALVPPNGVVDLKIDASEFEGSSARAQEENNKVKTCCTPQRVARA